MNDTLIDILNSNNDEDILLGIELLKALPDEEQKEIKYHIKHVTRNEWLLHQGYTGIWFRSHNGPLRRYFKYKDKNNWYVKDI